MNRDNGDAQQVDRGIMNMDKSSSVAQCSDTQGKKLNWFVCDC